MTLDAGANTMYLDDGCVYDDPEIVAMPTKPGDGWQPYVLERPCAQPSMIDLADESISQQIRDIIARAGAIGKRDIAAALPRPRLPLARLPHE